MGGKFSKTILSISDKGIFEVVDNNNNNNKKKKKKKKKNNNNNIINLSATSNSYQSKDLMALRQVYFPN